MHYFKQNGHHKTRKRQEKKDIRYYFHKPDLKRETKKKY